MPSYRLARPPLTMRAVSGARRRRKHQAGPLTTRAGEAPRGGDIGGWAAG